MNCLPQFGGKTVFLVGMLTLSTTSILIPVLARSSPYLVVGVRIIQVRHKQYLRIVTNPCYLPGPCQRVVLPQPLQLVQRLDHSRGEGHPHVPRLRRGPHRHRPHLPSLLLALSVGTGRRMASHLLRARHHGSPLVHPLLLPHLQQPHHPPQDLQCGAGVPHLLPPHQ